MVPRGSTSIKRPLTRLATSIPRGKKKERKRGRRRREESERFIYTRDILFILADTVSLVSNDTLGHVLRFIHVPSILRMVPSRYVISR